MTTLLLPWLPLVLVATMMSALAGRSRGWIVGAICGTTYVALIFSEGNDSVWASTASIIAVLLGAVTIMLAAHGEVEC